jgi:hypothetical protein
MMHAVSFGGKLILISFKSKDSESVMTYVALTRAFLEAFGQPCDSCEKGGDSDQSAAGAASEPPRLRLTHTHRLAESLAAGVGASLPVSAGAAPAQPGPGPRAGRLAGRRARSPAAAHSESASLSACRLAGDCDENKWHD